MSTSSNPWPGLHASAIEITSPYFLGSSDNPSSILVSKVFDGSGFATWKRSMTLALSAKNKLCFVDGSLPSPAATSDSVHNWNRINSMVISWLLNSLSKDIADSVLFLQSATEIWNELHQRYSQTNGALIFQIQQQLFSISQGTDDFSSYFTKIKKVWDELKMIQAVPPCSCGSAAALTKFTEEQRLIQLLMGLNDSYKAVRGQILMMNPLPTISTVHSIILHEERQRNITSTSNIIIDGMAMNVQSGFKKPLVCNHCKKPGHNKNQCYRLHGFPSHFKFTKSKSDTSVHNVSNSDSSSISLEQYNQLIQLLTTNKESAGVNSVLTNGSMDSNGPFIEE